MQTTFCNGFKLLWITDKPLNNQSSIGCDVYEICNNFLSVSHTILTRSSYQLNMLEIYYIWQHISSLLHTICRLRMFSLSICHTLPFVRERDTATRPIVCLLYFFEMYRSCKLRWNLNVWCTQYVTKYTQFIHFVLAILLFLGNSLTHTYDTVSFLSLYH